MELLPARRQPVDVGVVRIEDRIVAASRRVAHVRHRAGGAAHKSNDMARYLAGQRHWLRVEWLPPYAPDLNPVETLWGNVKGQELANLQVEDTLDVVDGLRAGLRRVQRSNLGFSFLQHAGLSFGYHVTVLHEPQ